MRCVCVKNEGGRVQTIDPPTVYHLTLPRTRALVLLPLPPREPEMLPEDIEVRALLLLLSPLREAQQGPVLRLAQLRLIVVGFHMLFMVS